MIIIFPIIYKAREHIKHPKINSIQEHNNSDRKTIISDIKLSLILHNPFMVLSIQDN